MTIVGIGLDLIDLERFGRLYALDDVDALSRCYSAKELSAAGTGEDAHAKLAARFAAKEAVLKVIGGLEDGIALTDIVIASHSGGPPTVSLAGGAKAKAAALKITAWHLSLTHTDTSAAAVAIGLSDLGS
jgi:holo-[acyl-carrier protein] synthase